MKKQTSSNIIKQISKAKSRVGTTKTKHGPTKYNGLWGRRKRGDVFIDKKEKLNEGSNEPNFWSISILQYDKTTTLEWSIFEVLASYNMTRQQP